MTARRSITTVITLVLTGIALLLPALTTPATAVATGGVKGTISSHGTVLPGLKVELTRADYDSDHYDTIASRTTSSAGAYAFSGLQQSDQWGDRYRYRIKVSDPASKFVTTVRNFTMVPGAVVTRDATLYPAGALTGKVLRADGAAPTTTRVHLIGPKLDIGTPDKPISAYDDDRGVAADGTYLFKGLPAGQYTVRYADASGTYIDQCYDDVVAAQSIEPTCASAEVPAAEVVTVTANETKTLNDQQLHNAGVHISGTVTNGANAPLKGINVTPYAVAGDSGPWGDYGTATTAAGVFHRGPLPAGQWKLYAKDPAGIWASQWVGGTSSATAQVFDLGPGEKVEGLAIKLKSRAVLKATVTPGKGSVTFAITVTRKVSGNPVTGQVTAAYGANTRSATLVNGKATIKLTGIAAGTRTFTVSYGGSGSTAPVTRQYVATVK